MAHWFICKQFRVEHAVAFLTLAFLILPSFLYVNFLLVLLLSLKLFSVIACDKSELFFFSPSISLVLYSFHSFPGSILL
jgi:hypothetical protein